MFDLFEILDILSFRSSSLYLILPLSSSSSLGPPVDFHSPPRSSSEHPWSWTTVRFFGHRVLHQWLTHSHTSFPIDISITRLSYASPQVFLHFHVYVYHYSVFSLSLFSSGRSSAPSRSSATVGPNRNHQTRNSSSCSL